MRREGAEAPLLWVRAVALALLRYSVAVQRQLPMREVGRRRRVEAAVSPVQTTVRLARCGGALALVLRLARCGAAVPPMAAAVALAVVAWGFSRVKVMQAALEKDR